MIRKIVWILLSCLMIISLVTVSCATPVSETPQGTDGTPAATADGADVPKYGGIYTDVLTADPMGFDLAYSLFTDTGDLVYDELMTGGLGQRSCRDGRDRLAVRFHRRDRSVDRFAGGELGPPGR